MEKWELGEGECCRNVWGEWSGRNGFGDGWTGGGVTMAVECLGPEMSGGGLGAHGDGGR